MKFFNRFSDNSKNVLKAAQKHADNMETAISSEHFLLALSEIDDHINFVLTNQGLSFDKIHLAVSLSKFTKNTLKTGLSDDAKKIIEKAYAIAQKRKSSVVENQDLFSAILKSEQSRAYQILIENNIDIDSLQNNKKERTLKFENDPLLNEIFNNNINDLGNFFGNSGLITKKQTSKKLLDEFSINLTEKAEKGEIDPLIGRDNEVNRMIVILNRRHKNNPVLVGEPGVGKTAIVEGLAQRIAKSQVPSSLIGKQIYSIDLASMISGTKYRGEFENRLSKIIKELKKDKNAIIFIDEIHNIVGAGAAEGAMDAANILKPALARGEIRVIGATTFDDFRKHIEKDSALERRMAKVVINEPSEQETLKILEGLSKKYENFHKIIIPKNVLLEILNITKRYINDKFFPDKAIDILDEASALKATNFSDKYNLTNSLKKKYTLLEKKKKQMVAKQDFEKAAQIRDEQKIIKSKISNKQRKSFSKPILTASDIAKVVSSLTGIPLGEIVHSEAKKLESLENILKENIKGQEDAIKKISATIRRSRTGVSSDKKPLGSFIFLGPTGVGKTELARVIAQNIFQDKSSLIKIDMSEFAEKHNVSRLIGAPPGYVGYEEAGKLTEAVKNKPYSVVLFDEIEKAHPDFQNILLQIFEDGELTDAKGKKISFKNTIIILTSNIGLREFNASSTIGFKKKDKTSILKKFAEYQGQVEKELKKHFRPEFLNRIDQIIYFKPLSKSTILAITKKEIDELKKRLANNNIKVKISKKIIQKIIKKGFDPENGARPIKRAIQTILEEPISDYLIANQKNKNLFIDLKKDKIIINKK